MSKFKKWKDVKKLNFTPKEDAEMKLKNGTNRSNNIMNQRRE